MKASKELLEMIISSFIGVGGFVLGEDKKGYTMSWVLQRSQKIKHEETRRCENLAVLFELYPKMKSMSLEEARDLCDGACSALNIDYFIERYE